MILFSLHFALLDQITRRGTWRNALSSFTEHEPPAETWEYRIAAIATGCKPVVLNGFGGSSPSAPTITSLWLCRALEGR